MLAKLTLATLALVGAASADAFESGNLKLLAPGGDNLWWIEAQPNNVVWTCRESTFTPFTIWINNNDTTKLTAITPLIAVEQNFNCNQGISANLLGTTPAGDGYEIILANINNVTDVYAKSAPFSIRALSVGYPPAGNTPTDQASASGASPSVFGESPDVDIHSCRLLGPIALTVQGLMGVLVILSLVYKRHREKPMRPWRIWLFDVSKQVVGQMFVHAFNVFISDLVSHHSSNNACVLYFLNILIDTTLGVGLIYVVLRVLNFIMAERFHLKGFESGVYGTPPSIKYWMRQAAIYVLALTTMKFMVIGLLALLPGLFTLGAWLLSWTWTGEGDSLEVIFVMGIFPIIMNILQFWLIDSIVKASGVALDLDTPDALDREPLFEDHDDDGDDDDAHNTTNVYSPNDIESHPDTRSLSPSSARSRESDKLHAPSEPKSAGSTSSSAGSSTPTPTQPVTMHAYPPSIASSASSSSPPQAPVLREARKLKPKRRSPPSPIHIHNDNRPAVNSPRPGPTPKTAPVAVVPAPAPAPKEEAQAWGDSWEDTDDWADKVGEEDWTGRRLEEKKSVLSGWDSGSPLVNSVHIEP